MSRPKPPVAVLGRTLLCLLRHGDAGDALALAERDAVRPLTGKGRRQAKRAGKALKRLGLLPRDVWTSRLRRAEETAEVATATLAYAPRAMTTAALAPEALPERIAKILLETPPAPFPEESEKVVPAARRKPATRTRSRRFVEPAPVVRWLVGHEPQLSRLVGHLTGAPAAAVRIPKGAVAVVGCDGRGPIAGACHLEGLWTPDALKSLLR